MKSAEENNDGWKFDYKFLKDLTYKTNEQDWGEGLSMEQVEAVLLAMNYTQSVTNEEIERMMDEFFKTYTDSTGWHNPPGWYAKDTWQYVKTSILPLLQSKTEQTNPIK